MDLQSLIKILWRYKLMACAIFVSINAAVILLAAFSPRIYEGEALILADSGRTLQQQTGDAFSAGQRQERFIRSQVRLAQSDDVVADAVKQVKARDPGPAANAPMTDKEPNISFIGSIITSILKSSSNETENMKRVQGSLRADVEPNTDLIRIGFRHTDPERAALYANQIAISLVERQGKLYANPLAAQFFKEREETYRRKLGKDEQGLAEFSKKTQTYSIEEQQRLLLARRDTIVKNLAETQSSLGRVGGELESLRIQLASLRSRINLPTEIFGEIPTNARFARSASGGAGLSEDPPLLHVRLYQESAQKIVNSNAEAAGLKTSEAVHNEEIRKIDSELTVLASRQGDFDRLKREIELDQNNIELYAKKSSEAEIDSAWKSNERLSNMQVVQEAAVPGSPIFPRSGILIPLGLLLGTLAACGAGMLRGVLAHGHLMPELELRREPTMPAATTLSPIKLHR